MNDNKANKFRRHFRIYFKNGHPAYIIDEEGNEYVFHRVTHSKTSGGRINIKIDNPLARSDDRATYIVKRIEKDKKGRFSLFELELKPNINIDDLDIKKAGGSQAKASNNLTTSKRNKRLNHIGNQAHHRINGSAPQEIIKAKKRRRRKRKHRGNL